MLRYRYTKLNKLQKMNYNKILGALKARETRVSIALASPNEASNLYFQVVYDYPELYFSPYQIGYATLVVAGEIRLDYVYSSSEIKKRDASIKKSLNEVRALVSSISSEYEKAKLVIEYIAKKTNYAIDNKYNQDISAVFHKETAQCSGYAKALAVALGEAGIDSIVVSGESNNTPHAWNIVKIDGSFYHVDVTFLDGVNNNSNDLRIKKYLFYDDELMSADHVWDKNFFPKCDDRDLYNKISAESIPSGCSYASSFNQGNVESFSNLYSLKEKIIEILREKKTTIDFELKINMSNANILNNYVQNTIKQAVELVRISVRYRLSKSNYYHLEFEYM